MSQNLPATTELHPSLVKLAQASNAPLAKDVREATLQSLGFLSACYAGRFAANDATARAWMVMLADYTPTEIARATINSLRSRAKDGQNYPPSLADIIEGCDDASAQRRADQEAAAKSRAENRFAYEYREDAKASGKWETLAGWNRDAISARADAYAKTLAAEGAK